MDLPELNFPGMILLFFFLLWLFSLLATYLSLSLSEGEDEEEVMGPLYISCGSGY